MGEWVLGKQQGRGKFVSKEGEIYEGEFKGGRMHGKGRFLHSNGTICTFMKIVSSLRRWDFISLLTVLRVTFLDDGNWDMDMKHGGALFYWVDGEVDACEYDGERLCYFDVAGGGSLSAKYVDRRHGRTGAACQHR